MSRTVSDVLTLAVNTASATGSLHVGTVSLKFNFSLKGQNKDGLSMSGMLPVTQGGLATGTAVVFTVGELSKTFNLNAKGVGGNKTNVLKVSGVKKGTFSSSSAKFTMALKNQSLFGSLSGFGFVNGTLTKSGTKVTMSMAVTVNGVSFLDSPVVTYVATKGKSGTGSKKK